MKKSNTLSILYLLLLISCKDKEDVKIERDNVKPTINILSPTDGQTFSTNETVSLSGNISDNRALKNISLRVTASSGEEIFNYTLTENDFTKTTRMKTSHHGPHNLVDVANIVLDTFFISPPTADNVEFNAEAADYDGNVNRLNFNLTIK